MEISNTPTGQSFIAKRARLLRDIAKEMEETVNHSNKLKSTMETLAGAEPEITRISDTWASFHKDVITPLAQQ